MKKTILRGVFAFLAVTISLLATVSSLDMQITNLTLYNADTDKPIDDLTNNYVINYATIGTKNISVVAIGTGADLKSVVFSYDSTSRYQIESTKPYAIRGDNNGNLNPWTPSVGNHTLKVTPYNKTGGTGTAGTPFSINFSVTEGTQNSPYTLSCYYNSSGSQFCTDMIWNKTSGTSGNDISFDVEFDSNGNIIVGSVSYTNEESITSKYDSNGNLIWNKTLPGSGIYDIAIDNTGNIYGIGRISNHVVKYDSNGNIIFNGITGASISDGGGAGIATDSLNNFIITSHNYNNDLIVEKYDSNGNLIWNRTYSGAGYDHGYSVDTDSLNNVYVTGHTRAVLGGNSDIVLLKYDSNGNLIWSKSFGGTEDESGYSLDTDNSGNIYITGRTQSFTNSIANGILLKYDSNGNLIFNRTFSNGDDTRGNSIAVKDNIYITGIAYTSGNDDLLFYIYDLNGNLLSENILSGYRYETGEGIDTYTDGSIVIVGHSDSSLSAYDNWIIKLNNYVNDTIPLPTGCSAIKYGGEGFSNKVNIVFVPSGFNGDMSLFRQKVNEVWSSFRNHTPFNISIEQLNVFYVPVESGNYCDYNCGGSPQLLCCDTAIAKGVSSECTSGPRQTVVIHNNITYGGAGYPNQDVATISVQPSANRIALHEIGHSLFNLGDEYTSGPSTPENCPNCDYNSCSKWASMIGYKGVNCVGNSCKQGNYSTSETTIMKYLNYDYEEVNLRASCCAYYQEAGSFPDYCSQFSQFVPNNDLAAYCTVAPSAEIAAVPLTEEPLQDPYEYSFIKSEQGEWELESVTPRKAGRYKQTKVNGEDKGNIEIEAKNGIKKTLRFEDTDSVEYTSEIDKPEGYIKVPRKTLSVIIDHNKYDVKDIKIKVKGSPKYNK